MKKLSKLRALKIAQLLIQEGKEQEALHIVEFQEKLFYKDGAVYCMDESDYSGYLHYSDVPNCDTLTKRHKA